MARGGGRSSRNSVRVKGVSTESVVICVLLVVLLVLVVYYVRQNNEGFQAEGEPCKLMFFVAKWCPHCKNAKPHWDKVKNKYDNKTENNIIKYGSTFDVVFSNGPKKKSDWIGIYKKDVIPGSSAPITWKYLNDSNQILSNGRISFLADFAPGEYQVLFFINDTFEILDDIDLIVLESPPVINAINKDQEIVILGDSITLSVDASGVEPVYYQWLKDDVPIASEKNSSLTLDSADFSAAGKYSVIVTNLGGSLKSKPINLIVILKPEILKITESI